MFVYEVNVKVEDEIIEAFESWLPAHARQVLSNPGFIRAHLCKHDRATFTMLYYVRDKLALNRYIESAAPALRQDAVDKFANKFTIDRRIYEIVDTIE